MNKERRKEIANIVTQFTEKLQELRGNDYPAVGVVF